MDKEFCFAAVPAVVSKLFVTQRGRKVWQGDYICPLISVLEIENNSKDLR
jgi:hypothetical protein